MKNIIEFSYHQRGGDKWSNVNHIHDDFYEILQVVSGKGNIVIKNKLYSMNKNDIYMINGSYMHCTMPEDPTAYVRNKMVLNKQFIDRIMAMTDAKELLYTLFNKNGGAYVKLNAVEAAEVDKIFGDIFDMGNRHQNNLELYATAQLMHLFFLCGGNIAENVSGEMGIVESAIRYINKNISSHLTIDIIAGHLHVNKYYLCHTFKKEIGMTVGQYITAARISQAKQLLIKTEKSVLDVALDVGFINISHFSATFTKMVGISPIAFRKKDKKGIIKKEDTYEFTEIYSE